jgi:sterol desaturase/sphingolipid hydroxylase (fatty acid hydroxylase superfamily)
VGRYHFDHHLKVDCNYSEMEILDKMFGTLLVWEKEPDYLNSPRLTKQISSPEKVCTRISAVVTACRVI